MLLRRTYPRLCASTGAGGVTMSAYQPSGPQYLSKHRSMQESEHGADNGLDPNAQLVEQTVIPSRRNGGDPAAFDLARNLQMMKKSKRKGVSLMELERPQGKEMSSADRVRGYRPLSLMAREEIANNSTEKTYHEVTPDIAGSRVDDYVKKLHPEWSASTVAKMVQQGHIYRFRKNGKKRYTRLTDRVEMDELLVIPKPEFWNSAVAPPQGVLEPEILSPADGKIDDKFSGQTAAIHKDEKGNRRASVPLSGKARQEALDWVLFKNKHVVVINKPSGVPMQPRGPRPGASSSASIDMPTMNVVDLLPAWKFTKTSRPFVCNYLDTETSGIVVLARSHEAHRMLGRMFGRRVVPNNVYWGFLTGAPKSTFGRIKMHFEMEKGRGGTQIIARANPTDTSKVGVAEYVVNASVAEYGSFVSFYPLTSRTSQLRIMAAHALRCPIVGDGKFGGESAYPTMLSSFFDVDKKDLPLHLHHRKIQLPYKNARGEFECVTAPLPPHLKSTFEKLGWPTDADDPIIPG